MATMMIQIVLACPFPEIVAMARTRIVAITKYLLLCLSLVNAFLLPPFPTNKKNTTIS